MKPRVIKKGVYQLAAIDWDRRLFDSLIPLPDGTSYNAYLIEGSDKTALLDTVDPHMADTLMSQLDNVKKIDYVVVNHAEQDHSGTLPQVLENYRDAKVITTSKARGMLIDMLCIPEDRFIIAEDGETVSLGDKTLQFIHMPWVHWPETMVTLLQEDRILFSCDLFGSHIATSDLYVTDEGRVYEAAKRYYAEIMMPFRSIIQTNLKKINAKGIDLIAPSHGPIYDRPAFITDAYQDWTSNDPKNSVVVPYISMHGSTRLMVDHLVAQLVEKGVGVHQFDLSVTDIGKLAMELVDAATIVMGTPTVLGGPHPIVTYAAQLANLLRPKAEFASVICSYSWGGKAIEQIAGSIPNLKVEILDPVLCKGVPKEADFSALSRLATTIADRHHHKNYS